MGFRALTDVLLGHGHPAKPGDLIPEHYIDSTGEKRPVDFERLVELGAAEKVTAADTKKAAAAEKAKADAEAQAAAEQAKAEAEAQAAAQAAAEAQAVAEAAAAAAAAAGE